jgi:hypothetical protein
MIMSKPRRRDALPDIHTDVGELLLQPSQRRGDHRVGDAGNRSDRKFNIAAALKPEDGVAEVLQLCINLLHLIEDIRRLGCGNIAGALSYE